MTKTNISWTDETWNPVTGCSKVSPGCQFCYAEAVSHRFGRTTLPWTAPNAAANVTLHPERLGYPLRWKKSRMVFVNSMSDLFHPLVPDDFIDKVFETMRWSLQHTFQILTKRPERMQDYMAGWVARQFPVSQWVLRNVWLGTSVEDQRRADERIPHLLATPAAVRFLSCEPLLGPLDLRCYLTLLDLSNPIHWIICGGESGSHLAKPEHADRLMHPEWARDLRDQAVVAGVPFFMKQHSATRPGQEPWIVEVDGSHTEWHQFPEVADAGK